MGLEGTKGPASQQGSLQGKGGLRRNGVKMSAHHQKNKQIMKRSYIRAGNPREGILEIGPWVNPIKGKVGNPRKPIRVEFLGEEEMMKGTCDVSTLDQC